MAIIGILGFIGSGKGTVADYLVKKHGYQKDSFAATLKDACSCIFNWPRNLLEGDTLESRQWRETVDLWWEDKLGIKNFSPRLALQLMGTDVIRKNFNDSMWLLTMENRLKDNPNSNIVIPDVRFPNEIALIERLNGSLYRVVNNTPPDWVEIAKRANLGDSKAMNIMTTTYAHVHNSEWAWVGCSNYKIIQNVGTLTDLYNNVDSIVN